MPKQALCRVPLGFGIVVEEKPSELFENNILACNVF